MSKPYDKNGICKFCDSHANSHFTGDCKKKGDWCGISKEAIDVEIAIRCPKCGGVVYSQ